MKEWWNNLALREKQTLILGGFFVSLFLLYELIWAPLSNKVTTLRSQIIHNQELLVWMENADKQIQTLEKNPAPQLTSPTTGSLLTIVQKQINRTPFVSNLNQLHQVDNDSVQLSFQKVDFDKLMAWLIQLTQQNGLSVIQISVMPSDTAGVVTAELVIKKN